MVTKTQKFLEHYGVKGMRWGQRRIRGSDGRVKSTEAKRAEKLLEKKKTKGTRSLTNKELGDLNKRLQMEQQLGQLAPKKKSKIKSGHNFVKEALAVGATVNAAVAFAKSPTGQALAKNIGKKSTGN